MDNSPVTPDELARIAQRLQQFVDQHQIVQDALKTCREIVKRFLKGDPNYLKGLQPHQLHYAAERQMLIFQSEVADTPLLRTRINIYLHKDYADDYYSADEVLAYYDRDTNVHGEYYDEWLIHK